MPQCIRQQCCCKGRDNDYRGLDGGRK
jgi:hypothetical protein